jgi:hypothetical protein
VITVQNPTTALYELPPTTVVTLAYAPCPVCARTNFNHPRHRSYHVAKCEREAQAADEPELRYREFLKDAAALASDPVALYNTQTAIARMSRRCQPWVEEV